MAYKSRVTNKYMGSSFAGQVASSNKSSTTDLINTLQREVNPALAKIADQYVETKKDAATKKLNQLFLNKDSKTVQQEILSGKHPELSNQYVQKTVSQHTGKHQAIDVIAKIESEKEQNYDFREGNLASFYKNYLPNFAEKDGSYALGFASVFNEYKAKEFIADAEIRSKYAKEQKINQGSKIISKADVTDVWDIINKDLIATKLPPEEGQTTSRQFYSNEEGNEVAIHHVNDLYNTATSTSDIDRGIKILNANRGVKKDGTKLGSLMDTKRQDVSELVNKLRSKRVTLENQDRLNKENKRKNDIRNIFSESSKKIEVTNEDGTISLRNRTYPEQLELRKKLQTYGDPVAEAAFDSMLNRNRYVNTDPAVFSQITSNIFEGGYGSQSELMRDLVDKNVSAENYNKALSYYTSYTNDVNNGVKPIYKTDFTYSTLTTDIINTIKGNFNVGVVGMEKPNSGEAIRNANAYIRKEVIDFEETFKQENNGKSPSRKQKDQFMMDLGNIMKTRFTPDNVQPSMQSFTAYEQEQKNIEIQRKAKKKEYDEAGVTQAIEALNKRFEIDKGLIKLPEMKSEDFDFFDSDVTDRKEFKQEKIIPFISKYLQTAFGDVPFTQTTMKAMRQEDFNQMLRNISEQFKGTGAFRIEPSDISDALKALTNKGN